MKQNGEMSGSPSICPYYYEEDKVNRSFSLLALCTKFMIFTKKYFCKAEDFFRDHLPNMNYIRTHEKSLHSFLNITLANTVFQDIEQYFFLIII